MQSAWDQVKTQIHKKMSHHAFMVWIEPLRCKDRRDDEVVLGCPSTFARKWVTNHYIDLIKAEVDRAFQRPCRITLEASNGKEENGDRHPGAEQLLLPNVTHRQHAPSLFRKNFTFDQFVVGMCNDFAYKAALALAGGENGYHNTLFLLSKTGLGKSHLSQAIGNHILHQNSTMRVCYMTAEDFTNAMVYALRHDSIEQFKEKYRRQCDMLLLEDVQFLSGKEKTQHELGYTLDALLAAGKKLIFTSSHLPNDIPKMDGKLASRMSSGIISGIESPDYETRVRIIDKKASLKSLEIPQDVVHYLASELTENVRQLESGLIGVAAKASLLEVPADLQLAESVVRNIARRSQEITVESIQKLVCKYCKISMEELLSRSRKRRIAQPRQIAMYLARRYTSQSFQAIGRSFNRYHATTLHAIGTVERHIREQGPVQKQVEFLCRRLESGNL
ncbi:MAG: chromosomal replication initiator protein DnaA [Deltaproteobacteria bacterium]|nr:chromosomal replication initiator protein DnaA [Deltaproteobacteria bacterium]MBW2331162.1 chromosomal replication initiator protein DnaA [Deltaproteobacteria bacterium]